MQNNSDIVLVQDYFADEVLGGAELTTEALIQKSGRNIIPIKAIDLQLEQIREHKDKLWIIGNFSMLHVSLFRPIQELIKYVVIEYDYKFCSFRNPAKHLNSIGRACDCEKYFGKMISEFMNKAEHIFFMSEKQRAIYLTRFPESDSEKSSVLSSIFSSETLNAIDALRKKKRFFRSGWVVSKSDSWVKGFHQSFEYCAKHKLKPKVLDKVEYEKALEIMAGAKGLVYLPLGEDTCPRMVIEAKLLGCQLALNDFVQHKDEWWFATEDRDETLDYLKSRVDYFWQMIQSVEIGLKKQ